MERLKSLLFPQRWVIHLKEDDWLTADVLSLLFSSSHRRHCVNELVDNLQPRYNDRWACCEKLSQVVWNSAGKFKNKMQFDASRFFIFGHFSSRIFYFDPNQSISFWKKKIEYYYLKETQWCTVYARGRHENSIQFHLSLSFFFWPECLSIFSLLVVFVG